MQLCVEAKATRPRSSLTIPVQVCVFFCSLTHSHHECLSRLALASGFPSKRSLYLESCSLDARPLIFRLVERLISISGVKLSIDERANRRQVSPLGLLEVGVDTHKRGVAAANGLRRRRLQIVVATVRLASHLFVVVVGLSFSVPLALCQQRALPSL